MHTNDESQSRERLAEREHIAATLATEQQWLAQLHRAAQDYLDRPNAATRGKRRRILGAIERRRVAGCG